MRVTAWALFRLHTSVLSSKEMLQGRTALLLRLVGVEASGSAMKLRLKALSGRDGDGRHPRSREGAARL